MAGTEEHPDVLRMVALFLRLTAGLSQTELGRAAAMAQSQVSRLESDPGYATEEALRRVAAAAGVPWPLVTRFRRSINSFLWSLSGGAGPLREADLRPHTLSALSSYFLEEALAEISPPSPNELRQEAERFWEHVKALPADRRRRAVELSPRASQNWALAVRICDECERAASSAAAEALELADLALGIAQRVEGMEGWRRRIQGYAWAYVGNARRAASDLAGADAAFATAWGLWRDSSVPDTGRLSERRMLSLEASLRQDQGRLAEANELLARARRSGGDAP